MDALFIYSFTHILSKMFTEQPQSPGVDYQAMESPINFVSSLLPAPPLHQQLLPHCPVPAHALILALSVICLTVTLASCLNFLLLFYLFFFLPQSVLPTCTVQGLLWKKQLLSDSVVNFHPFGMRSGLQVWWPRSRLRLRVRPCLSLPPSVPCPPLQQARGTWHSPDMPCAFLPVAYPVRFCLKCPLPLTSPVCQNIICHFLPEAALVHPSSVLSQRCFFSWSKYHVYLWACFLSVFIGALRTWLLSSFLHRFTIMKCVCSWCIVVFRELHCREEVGSW